MADDEEFVLPHRASILRQVAECVADSADGAPHALHRRLTGLTLLICNCGYTSGWAPTDSLPTPPEFFDAHGVDPVEMMVR